MEGFNGPAEAMDFGSTLLVQQRSFDAGWKFRTDTDSNQIINVRKDGKVTLECRFIIEPEDARRILNVLRKNPDAELDQIVDVAAQERERTRDE